MWSHGRSPGGLIAFTLELEQPFRLDLDDSSVVENQHFGIVIFLSDAP